MLSFKELFLEKFLLKLFKEIFISSKQGLEFFIKIFIYLNVKNLFKSFDGNFSLQFSSFIK